MAIEFHSAIPILRIFDLAKADEFYLGYLGFRVDWDHRFDDRAPLYRQISRGGLRLHLSEHHGDGSPGVHVRVMMRGCHRGPAPGSREMGVVDPFGNQIKFCQDDGDEDGDED
ncbi:hypothetical protein G6O67_008857 [Ophiocordyceps sinensis]|uniref:Glyoxalase/bleomycin resistance protein/dioxygenase n=1 Tax=Ophiocordyceps sinensis TaxID=72228 RepID=A0A8H4LPG1_9HYPO|nr:hypothetical protein G6O67_008857 [Ophiocordyceps sinensis]